MAILAGGVDRERIQNGPCEQIFYQLSSRPPIWHPVPDFVAGDREGFEYNFSGEFFSANRFSFGLRKELRIRLTIGLSLVDSSPIGRLQMTKNPDSSIPREQQKVRSATRTVETVNRFRPFNDPSQ